MHRGRIYFTNAKVEFLQTPYGREDTGLPTNVIDDTNPKRVEENSGSNMDAIHATQAHLTQPTNPPIVAIA